MSKRATSAVALVLLVVLGAARTVVAESDKDRKDRAIALLKEGRARYDLGRFEQAIELCERAYEVYPYPEALFNLGQSHRQLKNYERAIFYFRAYLRNKPDSQNRTIVEEVIKELEGLIAAQNASAEKPPEGTQEPSTLAEPPSPRPRAEGASSAPRTTPGPENDPRVSPSGSATSRQPRAFGSNGEWYEDAWGWGATGLGAIALGSGIAFFLSARELRADIPQANDESERLHLAETADSRQSVGTALVASGGFALAAGIAMLAWSPHTETTSVTVSLSPHGGFLGVVGVLEVF